MVEYYQSFPTEFCVSVFYFEQDNRLGNKNDLYRTSIEAQKQKSPVLSITRTKYNFLILNGHSKDKITLNRENMFLIRKKIESSSPVFAACQFSVPVQSINIREKQ